MKLAVMQPYFVPYLGYWQLLHAVDRFVIYDDVNFIVRGWINRNRILREELARIHILGRPNTGDLRWRVEHGIRYLAGNHVGFIGVSERHHDVGSAEAYVHWVDEGFPGYDPADPVG